MTRERALDWYVDEIRLLYAAHKGLWHEPSFRKLGEKLLAAGERLGREDSDSVYWPALCEQWRIEFGKELGREGGHIMNIVDSVRELVREEREKVLADFRTVRPNI